MSEYYAVQRSMDHLAHYGVKGMKWGVRRALEKNDQKALSKQYRKALNKAKKLNTKASISRSQAEYKGRMPDAAIAGISGGLLAGGSLAARAIARSKGQRTTIYGMKGIIPVYFDTETSPKYTVPIGAAMGAYGAYNLGKGLAAKYRTTKKGHAKAQTKAENWKKEMRAAFKNTKYSQLHGTDRMNPPYNYVPAKKQLKDAAVDSATYPGFSRNRQIASETPASKTKHKKRRK